MFTNPHIYDRGELVAAPYLNADARDNVGSIFALSTSTESLLNPVIVGALSFASNIPYNATNVYGNGFPIGSIGIETSLDAAGVSTREWRFIITYTLATNSNSGTYLGVHTRNLGDMARRTPITYSEWVKDFHYTTPTETTSGRKFRVSGWIDTSSIQDSVLEIRLAAYSNDSPKVAVSDVHIAIQARDY